jgi:hypothetical protein
MVPPAAGGQNTRPGGAAGYPAGVLVQGSRERALLGDPVSKIPTPAVEILHTLAFPLIRKGLRRDR